MTDLQAATAELDRRAKRNGRLAGAGDEIEQSVSDYRRDLKNLRYVSAHAEAENLMRIIERVLNG